MKVRRVVTGHDEQGTAVFSSDGEVDASGPLGGCLWAEDALPTFPNDGQPPGALHSYYPPVGGFRFYLSRIRHGADRSAAQEFLTANLHLAIDPGYADADGFHTDDCITFHLVLDGSVTLELDGGEQRTIGPGEVIVQNGTRHRWLPDDEPATVAMVMIGTPRSR